MNWASVERLFAAAVETPPADRPALLDAEADEVVRVEVSRLLAEHDALSSEHDSFLATLDLDLAATLIDAREPRDPAVVGRYEIIRRLGAGATGVVYLARDPPLGRHVALKLLAPHLSQDATGIRRFTDEARTASRLDHPHIVAIHEIGRSDGDRLFIAMAHHGGGTLRDRIAQGPLPVSEAVRIASEVADGLSAAHAEGIVHRDIKPENILLTPRGACIVDFGIAKVAGGTVTRTGAALGTAAYMSPEQTRGMAVDHRSDLWSLGVVLYEMLTGERPFRADGGEALVYGIRHDAVEPVRARRRDLAPAVARVVDRLLEKEPRRRYQSAAAVLSALREPSPPSDGAEPAPGDRRPMLRRPAIVIAGAALLLLMIGALAYFARRPEPARFERNLLAVAPFDVPDSSLQLWREGLVDILSLDLDGAGPLRTVPQTVVLRRWAGRSDQPSAERLARRTDAELVVFGHLVRRGQDSIRIRVAVLDRSRNVLEQDVEVVGEERHMGALADSLGVQILRTLGRSRAIGSHRHGSIASRSLPALKAFLRGEQFYRLGLWDSAFTQYDRALAADSTFALALRRLAWVVAWRRANAAPYASQPELRRRAVALNRGLSPRDSALLTADSLELAAVSARTADEYVENLVLATQSRNAMAQRYPDDPEIWYHIGERQMHGTPPFGGSAAPTLEAFERAIALDPGFAPAYDHVFTLAMRLGRPDLAAGYARTYPVLNGSRNSAPSIRLVWLVLDSGGVHVPAVRRETRSASVGTLVEAGRHHFRWWADSAETAVALLRELMVGHHDASDATPPSADSLLWRQYLAWALAFRGHLHAAHAEHGRLLTDPGASLLGVVDDPFDDLALLGVVADSLARRAYGHGLASDADWNTKPTLIPPRHLRGLPWWLSRGDTASIAWFARRASEVVRAAESPIAVLRGRYFGAAATAYLALARGDSAGAVRRLRAIPDTLCLVGACFPEKLALARLLEARGEDRPAAEILDHWSTMGENRPSAVLAALQRARIAERLGQRARARERYRYVANVWRKADPELQAYVTEARDALRRLGT